MTKEKGLSVTQIFYHLAGDYESICDSASQYSGGVIEKNEERAEKEMKAQIID